MGRVLAQQSRRSQLGRSPLREIVVKRCGGLWAAVAVADDGRPDPLGDFRDGRFPFALSCTIHIECAPVFLIHPGEH